VTVVPELESFLDRSGRSLTDAIYAWARRRSYVKLEPGQARILRVR
jgi:hypothetical protein